MSTIPKVSEEFIRYLEKTFPPRCIQPNTETDTQFMYAGKVELAQSIIKANRREDEDAEELSVEV
ncbi:MAG: hypothetical protein JJ891_06890 [Rhizobiaceae bacterium]|nr:hypothetical protein [Rhizobiaceae bacterium]